MNNKRSNGACNTPVSMSTTDAYRDNWDKIFGKAAKHIKSISLPAKMDKQKEDCGGCSCTNKYQCDN